jgi:predicted signal transduction protein with EAL and GGDEF domain
MGSITLSAGLATVIPESGSSFEEIITAADKALYQAKAAGRDCFKHNNRLMGMKCNMRASVSQILMAGWN